MTIIFISLNNKFNEICRNHGFKAINMRIEDYIPNSNKKTYYVSPANSLCFMDGGIDLALSRRVFPGIEPHVKDIVKRLNIRSLVGKYYLPIGSSIIVDYDHKRSLVLSPTMLLPQKVDKTQNAYYATMAILYNIHINKRETVEDIDIIFTALCCGHGKMDNEVAMNQILKGIREYHTYKPHIINENIIINEPNMHEQPKYYENTEWFHVEPSEVETIK